LGWLVIPIRDKKPDTRHGHNDATRDPEQRQDSESARGILCGSVTVDAARMAASSASMRQPGSAEASVIVRSLSIIASAMPM
jgi:hypothetical protein